jgi:uncharacterized protein YegL
MSEPLGNVLPIYFVADESTSMRQDIGELNAGLTSLLDALQSETMAASKVRFCILGFSDDARCYMEPMDLRETEAMPKLKERGSTSFAAAFRELFTRIPKDVAALKSQGYLVNRPAVFFLTDGAPNPGDGWEGPYADLTAPTFGPHPNILAFGIGSVDPVTIKKIATQEKYAFVAAAGIDTGRAITEFIKALTHSVINSGNAIVDGNATLPIEQPKGFISLAVETV